MWSSGDVVALRNVWFGRTRGVSPGFVVEDGPTRFVAWIPIGAPYRGPEPRGVPTQWELVDSEWVDGGLAVHLWDTEWIATHVRPDDGAAWWYVDVVDSVRRTAIGLDYRDLLLDVVTEERVRVVDEDELAEAVRIGVVSEREAARAAEVAAGVVELLEQGAPPFDGEWEAWTPPPRWGIPQLPPGV